jgi:hypothetical protein
VGFVDHEEADGGLADAGHEARRGEALGRDVQQAQIASRGPGHGLLVGGGVPLGVDERNAIAEATRLERVDLVLHQRDERRDDDRKVLARQPRKLVAERLARPRRHDDEGIAPGQGGLARVALAGAEAGVAEELAEKAVEVHGGHTTESSGGQRAIFRCLYACRPVIAKPRRRGRFRPGAVLKPVRPRAPRAHTSRPPPPCARAGSHP